MDVAPLKDFPFIGERVWYGSTAARAEPLLLTARSDRAGDCRLLWLLLGMWVIHLFDLGFTLLAREQGLLVELNPLAARLLPYGDGGITAYKLFLLVIGTYILWSQRRLPTTEKIAWAYAIVCVGLSLWWHLLYSEAEPTWMYANQAVALLPAHHAGSMTLLEPSFATP